jgi:hypothetical protein
MYPTVIHPVVDCGATDTRELNRFVDGKKSQD